MIQEYGSKPHHEGKEEQLQEQCMTYCRHKYGKYLIAHIPNESRSKPQYRAKLKRLGLVAGMPDIMVFAPSGGYHGLAIELKRKYTSPNDTQIAILTSLQSVGWYSTWLRSFDAFKDLIDRYMSADL